MAKSSASGGGEGGVNGAGARLGDLISRNGVPVLIAFAGVLLIGALASRNIGASLGIVRDHPDRPDLPARPAIHRVARKGHRQRRLLTPDAVQAPQAGPLLPAGLPAPLAHLPDRELAASRCPAGSSCARLGYWLACLPADLPAARLPACSGALVSAVPDSVRLLALPLAAAWGSRAGRSTAARRIAPCSACSPWRLRPRHARRPAPLPAAGHRAGPARRSRARPRPQLAPATRVAASRAPPGCCSAIRSRSRRPRPASRAVAPAPHLAHSPTGSPAAAERQDDRGPGRRDRPLRGCPPVRQPHYFFWSQPGPAHPDRRLGGLPARGPELPGPCRGAQGRGGGEAGGAGLRARGRLPDPPRRPRLRRRAPTRAAPSPRCTRATATASASRPT